METTIAPALGWCPTCHRNVRLERIFGGYYVCAVEWKQWAALPEAMRRDPTEIEPGAMRQCREEYVR